MAKKKKRKNICGKREKRGMNLFHRSPRPMKFSIKSLTKWKFDGTALEIFWFYSFLKKKTVRKNTRLYIYLSLWSSHSYILYQYSRSVHIYIYIYIISSQRIKKKKKSSNHFIIHHHELLPPYYFPLHPMRRVRVRKRSFCCTKWSSSCPGSVGIDTPRAPVRSIHILGLRRQQQDSYTG